VWLMSNSDLMAYNEPGKEPNVKIEEKTFTEIGDKLDIPAQSISVYRFETKN